ncbi:peptidoglycan-binding protein [Bosea sp. TWI1241]|uniref:peptidoglycan recognition protein family protein n=1 Tax=Bosea sp. TWI1241 TaxID=3148904 RepID=UPI00320A2F74
MTLLDAQRILKQLGFYSGNLDSDWGQLSRAGARAFQASRGLRQTGLLDEATTVALAQAAPAWAAASVNRSLRTIPAAWLPKARMRRIHFHWTGGTYKASAGDRKHYHLLIDGDAGLVRGTPSIALNVAPIDLKSAYAAHTLNANGDAIGVAVCCMGGGQVSESPFRSGAYPMTRAQFEMMARVAADLCRFYDIPVGPKTTLSHAEVQPNLGIQQRGKWDFTRLSFEPGLIGAKACGDRLRAAITSFLAQA